MANSFGTETIISMFQSYPRLPVHLNVIAQLKYVQQLAIAKFQALSFPAFALSHLTFLLIFCFSCLISYCFSHVLANQVVEEAEEVDKEAAAEVDKEAAAELVPTDHRGILPSIHQYDNTGYVMDNFFHSVPIGSYQVV